MNQGEPPHPTRRPLKDFTAVAPLTSQPYVLVSGKSSGITNVRELIAAAKAKPGGLKFGSTGIGTGSHLGLEEFTLQAGITAVHVPPRLGDAIAELEASIRLDVRCMTFIRLRVPM